MRSISDDDLCSSCTHYAYVPTDDHHTCPHAFPGVTNDDDYVISCVQFQSKISQQELLRTAVAAKLAYWDALTALERSFSTELTDEQNDAMANVVDILASSAPSAAAITDENALNALNTILNAKE